MSAEEEVEAVLFAASFRSSGERGGRESPNINHALVRDRSRTICGRGGWATEEGKTPISSICCLRCMAGLERGVR